MTQDFVECVVRMLALDSYIFKVIVASIAHPELVINRLVPYGPLTTSIVLSSPVPDEPIKQEAFRRSQATLSKR